MCVRKLYTPYRELSLWGIKCGAHNFHSSTLLYTNNSLISTCFSNSTDCCFLSHVVILTISGVALMTTINKLNFITGNKNKLAEVRAILGSVINVENQVVDVPEIQGSIEDIAKEKSRRAAEVVRNRQPMFSILTRLPPNYGLPLHANGSDL